ncbi:MAG: response regulator transcription factor [Actinomycetota bacterium]|nr:response regulator transcription factor [Actinomycetota bacterium]
MGLAFSHLRVGVLDSTGETYAVVARSGLGVALRRLAATTDPLAEPRCDMVVHASYGDTDWTAVGRCAARISTVVVVAPATDDDARRALDAGAFGHIDANLPADAIGRALAGALRGEPAFPRRIFAELLRRRGESPSGMKILALTPRQLEVAQLIAGGAADKEIANALGIATTTAQKHVTHLLKRLDVPNRAAAAAIVAASGAHA